MKFLPNLQT